jgi:hypothetical protein
MTKYRESHSIALTSRRANKWTTEEDSKLNDAVQIYGGKD